MRSKTEAKKTSITQAALRLFLQKGFTSTTMEAVAMEAGASKQTLYSYYTNKEALFVDVTARHVDELWEDDHAVPSAGHSLTNLEHQLQSLGRSFVQHLMQPEYLALLRIVIAETPRHPELAQAFQARVPQRALKLFKDILQSAQRQGIFQARSEVTAARLLVGGLILYVLMYGLLNQPNDTETIEIAVNEIITEFLQSHTAKPAL